MEGTAVSKIAALLTSRLIVVASASHVFAQEAAASAANGLEVELDSLAPVSYTHLTLPTILRV